MKTFVLLLPLSLAIGSAAAAQTKEQLAAVKHIATAAALADVCPSVKINGERVVLITSSFKLAEGDPKDGPIARAMRKARAEADADAKPLAGDSTGACAVALLMYGPSGGNVQGLLLPR